MVAYNYHKLARKEELKFTSTDLDARQIVITASCGGISATSKANFIVHHATQLLQPASMGTAYFLPSSSRTQQRWSMVPTCDRGFPCTRMWRQTSRRRASPGSILSCGHRNVQPVTQASTRVQRLLPSASVALRMPKEPSHYRTDLYELPL